MERGADAAARGALRFGQCPQAPAGGVQCRCTRELRLVLPCRGRGLRGVARLCGAHTSRQASGLGPAAPRARRRHDGDRSRDAAQSRAGARAGRPPRRRARSDDGPPLFARDGGFIRAGYRGELDEQRTLRDDSRKTVAALEAKYRTSAGVPSLKIRHNNMIGYHIEVTATHADKLDLAALGFTRRQSMSNATRFSTAELAELETRIGRAADQALALELAIFDELVTKVTAVSTAV